MRFFLFALISFFAIQVSAELILAPRYEYIRGHEDEMANRFILKSKLNYSQEMFSFYAEGFGEFEANEDQSFIRRSPTRGYLQEAYLEVKKDSFYIRAGLQPIRWSEMWSLPSLDIWSGRRFNRLFFDPYADQLTHSTGVLFSYARQSWSLDLVAIAELAEYTVPVPIPAQKRSEDMSAGARFKFDVKGFSFSTLAAQLDKKNYFGATGNYAFDQAVPKIEVGYAQDVEKTATSKDQVFATAGLDLFLGNWVVLPQISTFDVQDLSGYDKQTTVYLSAQWNPNRHDLFFQIFQNIEREDIFASASYGYNITDYFTTSVFVQSYAGKLPGLYNYYEEITGGTVAGVRFEFTKELSF